MPYAAPVAEQRFVLEHVCDLPALAGDPRFADATPDVVDAILEGAASLAEGEFAPLNVPGDRTGAKLGPDGVTTPDGFDVAYRAYVEGGWNGISGPVEFGGQGLPTLLSTVVLEDFGTSNLAFSLVSMLSNGAVEALVAHGTEDQRNRWLPKLVSGEWTGTMNLTEPQAGSDVGALRTTAVRQDDGGYRIKGTKIFITWGEHDLTENIVHLVLARVPGAPAGTKGISLFLVPRVRADGSRNDVRAASIEHKLGIHASPTCVMQFGDHDACDAEIIGGEGEGMRAMFTMMNNARLNVGLQGVSVAERATQQAVDYATTRVQSARAGGATRDPVAIVQHPDVRRMLIRMKALTQAARALTYYALAQVDRAHLGQDGAKARLDLLTPLAKAYASDVGVEVASLGVQVHGGMGFVEETGAAQHYRDARIIPIYEGTNGIQAADLVNRKLGQDGGAALASLLEDVRGAAADAPTLRALADGVEQAARWLGGNEVAVDDRLGASYPFLTMLSVATAGMLMARQLVAADGDTPFLAMKRAACRFYLERVVPEALGLLPQATGTAQLLYSVDEAALAA